MIIIYTDGSTLKNGNKDAVGGFGVVVCQGEPKQKIEDYKVIAAYAERAEGTTNNRMEMSAILYALKNYGVSADDFHSPIVYSDSMYCVNSFTTWIKGWKAKGWVRAKNQPLENKDLILEYDRLTTQEHLTIDLRYVKGHNRTIWNELADQLATGRKTAEEVMQEYG
jgi:ribonuclease HI